MVPSAINVEVREFGNNEVFCRGCGTLKRREYESVLCDSTSYVQV